MTHASGLCCLFPEFPKKNDNNRIAKTDYESTTTGDQRNYSTSHIACASWGAWTLVVRTEGLSLAPYQLGYRSLRKSAFHSSLYPQLRAQLFTYHHLQPFLPSFVLCRKRLECRQLLFSFRMVSSLYCLLELEAAFPLWKTLESHTRLVLIHCTRIRWWTGTHPSCSSCSPSSSESSKPFKTIC